LKYVMVTHWDGHWDALPNNEAHYTKKMIRFELKVDKLLDRTSTLFVKLNKETKKPEKAWNGYVYGFKDENNKVRFKVHIEKSISLTDIPQRYLSLKEGWYLEAERVEPIIPHEFALYPPFFYSMLTTSNWKSLRTLHFGCLN